MVTTYTPIPYSDPEIVSPGRGCEQWHDRNDVNIPVQGAPILPSDRYVRSGFVWSRFETSQGVYNWAYFDGIMNQCIANRQRLSIGIMTVYTDIPSDQGGLTYDGGVSAYPLYLHQMMQNETVKDWKVTAGGRSTWIPNWNSPSYHARLLALNQALNAHIIQAGYQKAVGVIDIRGYGNWGEWHSAFYDGFTVSMYPSGTFPTYDSLKKIVDAHINGFPTFPLVCMIAAFDCQRLQNTWNPKEIAYYCMTAKNQWGNIGWRADQYGATDGYIAMYLQNNTTVVNGVAMNTLIMPRYQSAAITGEPGGWNPGNDFAQLEPQVQLRHTMSFGNGNLGTNTPNSAIQANVRAASKRCGYRFEVRKVDSNFNNGVLTINTDWVNTGIGNLIYNYDIVFELLNSSNQVVWSLISTHKLKFFQPTGNVLTVKDSSLINLPQGTYKLQFQVKDRLGFTKNILLAIQGGSSAGVYQAGTVTIGATVPNQPPVANAGSDKAITLPTNMVSLAGTASDPDGTITAWAWTKLSGSGTINSPNTQTTNITGLTEGTSIFRLTVTDNKGATAFDDVSVIVRPDPTPIPEKEIVKITATITKYDVLYDNGETETVPA